eukprot:3619678-Alexandrium_andersonii.AAC.1
MSGRGSFYFGPTLFGSFASLFKIRAHLRTFLLWDVSPPMDPRVQILPSRVPVQEPWGWKVLALKRSRLSSVLMWSASLQIGLGAWP